MKYIGRRGGMARPATRTEDQAREGTAVVSAQERLAELARLAHTSISPSTGLATDFLNQYNEISMTLDFAEEMPDAIMEFVGWYPRTYQEHFKASGFRDTELLIAAFELAPPVIRSRFNALVRELNIIVLSGLTSLQSVLREDPEARIGPAAAVLAREMREHAIQLAALINGPRSAEQQSSVDAIFDDDATTQANGDNSGGQDDIDALFADANGGSSQDDIDALFN